MITTEDLKARLEKTKSRRRIFVSLILGCSLGIVSVWAKETWPNALVIAGALAIATLVLLWCFDA